MSWKNELFLPYEVKEQCLKKLFIDKWHNIKTYFYFQPMEPNSLLNRVVLFVSEFYNQSEKKLFIILYFYIGNYPVILQKRGNKKESE